MLSQIYTLQFTIRFDNQTVDDGRLHIFWLSRVDDERCRVTTAKSSHVQSIGIDYLNICPLSLFKGAGSQSY
nr:hypothetical protein [Pantoea bituminis]